ncbi:hypothetical protein J22TS1_00730 [Siminovitchia terrae]|nr:hypothetical protein J22TS1_00730 [Siminovitchia terrae]
MKGFILGELLETTKTIAWFRFEQLPRSLWKKFCYEYTVAFLMAPYVLFNSFVGGIGAGGAAVVAYVPISIFLHS